jgi:hypothetical protein
MKKGLTVGVASSNALRDSVPSIEEITVRKSAPVGLPLVSFGVERRRKACLMGMVSHRVPYVSIAASSR